MRRLAAFLLVLTACPGRGERPAPAPRAEDVPARAFRVERAEDLVAGPAAAGTVGDFRLDNGRVAFIVSDAPIAYGFSETGGNLMDAAPVGGRDALSQLHLYLGDDFPRQARYAEVAVGDAEGATASLVARGVDSKDATLAVTTVYTLARGSDTLVLRTTVANTGAAAVTGYAIGDVLSWGQAEHFAPGHGFVFRGRLEIPWLAGVGEDVSYGYTAATGLLGGPHGSAWSDTIVRTVDLAPGASATIERYFVVGTRPDVAGVLARLHALRGEPRARVRGVVREVAGGPGIAQVRVTARQDGKPQVVAVTGEGGAFELPLAPGRYQLDATGDGRVAAGEVTIDVPAADAPAIAAVELEITRSAEVAFTIHERRGDARVASPGKLTFRGLAPTPDPVLGPRHRAAGAGHVLVSATGRGRLALAPGRYDVYASRGLEFDLWHGTIDLPPGGRVRVDAELARVVDTTGYVSADFHQHQLPSPDSAVSFADRITANLAEGVELAVATDHNQITDLGPAAAEIRGAVPLGTVVGLEATTENIGHFMAYPLERAPHRSRGGAPHVDGKTATEIFGLLRALAPEIVLQVNHPRSQKSGYFDLSGFPATDLSFDALEVLNGKRVADFDRVLADWFLLLARGLPVTAMGGSDSHAIVGQECGYPRVFLGLGDDPLAVRPADLLAVIKRRRDVLVTNGPYLTLRARGASAIGGRFALAPSETLELELTVQAAPWVDVDRVEIYESGRLVETQPVVAASAPVRHRATLRWSRPGFYVVVVRGDGALDPVVPATDVPVTPIAVTNAVWIERR